MDREMDLEEAQNIIRAKVTSKRVDDVYPWWTTLRGPMILLSVVLMALCTSVIVLGVTLRSVVNDRSIAADRDECYDRYTNNITHATSIVRGAQARTDNSGWRALLSFAENGNFDLVDPTELETNIRAGQEALKLDERSFLERDAWIASGRELPCALQADGSVTPGMVMPGTGRRE